MNKTGRADEALAAFGVAGQQHCAAKIEWTSGKAGHRAGKRRDNIFGPLGVPLPTTNSFARQMLVSFLLQTA